VTLTEDERRESAAAIDEEAERLAGLVHSLLDMSRIQAGALRPEPEPYDVAELVEVALRRAAGNAGQRIVERIQSDLPPVLVDAALFDVAVANVLDNALRYAPPPAEVRLTAALSDDRSRVILSVDDGGPGVPADALPRLFDRFYRVPLGVEPARHGLGMGLAIARGFAEAMGATIEAGRSDLGGLVVRMGLPVAPPRGPEPPGWP
jgi:two-component system sensor histidine kinase KdpD